MDGAAAFAYREVDDLNSLQASYEGYRWRRLSELRLGSRGLVRKT